MDRRVLERTVEFAKNTHGFDFKRLPQTLRVAGDSAPLQGAGLVEDTINLLWHAARKVVELLAATLQQDKEALCEQAILPCRPWHGRPSVLQRVLKLGLKLIPKERVGLVYRVTLR